MQKVIALTDLQRRFDVVLDEVSEEDVPYVLTRDDQPRAALVPYGEYLRFKELSEKDVLKRFRRLRTKMARASAHLTEDEVAREVEAARAELGD